LSTLLYGKEEENEGAAKIAIISTVSNARRFEN
jgi:hypothetical protein